MFALQANLLRSALAASFGICVSNYSVCEAKSFFLVGFWMEKKIVRPVLIAVCVPTWYIYSLHALSLYAAAEVRLFTFLQGAVSFLVATQSLLYAAPIPDSHASQASLSLLGGSLNNVRVQSKVLFQT